MTRKILLATILGGLAMYAWVALAHMVLPLGEAGIREIPNEAAVLSTLTSNLGSARGLYLYPGMGLPPNATSDQKKAATAAYPQKLASMPVGVLMYNPAGSVSYGPGLFLTEFGVELLNVFLAVVLLAQARPTSYAKRVLFVAAIGLIAALATNMSYWDWYGFPTSYTAAYITTQFVGFVCAGLVAAAFIKEGGATVARAAAA
ncbi:MAG TPA: hypothetical protein VFA04_16640 [Bryobacteraceae bacterium]|jgi:hypothetical protein|nr:hypothetical protein [Bryobacteraceae bacterium]